jgi:hypothetical protein
VWTGDLSSAYKGGIWFLSFLNFWEKRDTNVVWANEYKGKLNYEIRITNNETGGLNVWFAPLPVPLLILGAIGFVERVDEERGKYLWDG